MRIAITGHRPNKLGNDYSLNSPLIKNIKKELQKLIDHYKEISTTPLILISGMALGIDTLWALLAIENNLKLIAAIPCIGQQDMWPMTSQNRYNTILSQPNVERHYVTQQPYSMGCMQKRNMWMVNECDVLIAVFDGTTGGTYNCVHYAMSQSKTIITINPRDYANKS